MVLDRQRRLAGSRPALGRASGEATAPPVCGSRSPTSTPWCPGARRSTAMPASTPPRSTPRPGSIPCCPSACRRISRRWCRTRTGWRSSSRSSSLRTARSTVRRSIAPRCAITPSSPTTASPPGSRGEAPAPAALAAIPGLEENLRWQDAAAQQLRDVRHEQGALDLETIEARAVFVGDEIADLEQQQKNRARELIEDLMIAANAVTARFLDRHGLPSLRRVLRSPERWDRIVERGARGRRSAAGRARLRRRSRSSCASASRPIRCASRTSRSPSSS